MLSYYKKILLMLIVAILIFFTLPYSKNTNETALSINNKNCLFNLLKDNYIYIEDNYFNALGTLYHFTNNKLYTIDYFGNIKVYNINPLKSTYDKVVYNLSNYENNEISQLVIYKSKGNKVYLQYPNLYKVSRDLDILNKNQFINNIIDNNYLSYENLLINYMSLSKHDLSKALK